MQCAVGDDERRTVIGFGLDEGLDHLSRVGQGDVGHIDVAVGHGHHPQILLGHRLAAGGELGHGAGRGGFGGLAAGVGVDFGVEDQQVDVLAGGDDMVEAAVADVIGPAVAADAPDRFLDQVVGQRQQLAWQPVPCSLARAFFRLSTRAALRLDAGLVGLVGAQDLLSSAAGSACRLCSRS